MAISKKLRDFLIYEYLNSGTSVNPTPPPIGLNVPTDTIAVEPAPYADIVLTWNDSLTNATEVKIYREVVLSEQGNQNRVLIATLAVGVETYEDLDTEEGKEHIYDIQSSDGVSETNVFDYSKNASSVTTTQNTAVQGLYFDNANVDRLNYQSTKTYSGIFNIQVGIQGLSDVVGEIGLVGASGGSSNRILLDYGNNRVRANIAGGSLLTSGSLSPALDLTGRKIIEIYRDALDDIYIVDGVNPAQYLFTKAGNFSVNALMQTGGFGTTGYLWYFNDGDQEFEFSEGSGATLTSTDTNVSLNILTTQDLNYINNTMWTDELPLPVGAIEVENLGVNGNYSSQVLSRMTDINSKGHSHLVFMVGTNDIANGGTFVPVATYQQNCEDIIQSALDAGSVPIFATIGTLDDAVKKAQKDYTAFYGNESTWNFNALVGAPVVDAIIPNYMAALVTACSNKGIAAPIDLFNDIFIAQGTSPNYGDLITSDGTHWSLSGYMQSGEKISDYLKTLTGVTSIGAVGDSLMFGGLAQQIDNYYNA